MKHKTMRLLVVAILLQLTLAKTGTNKHKDHDHSSKHTSDDDGDIYDHCEEGQREFKEDYGVNDGVTCVPVEHEGGDHWHCCSCDEENQHIADDEHGDDERGKCFADNTHCGDGMAYFHEKPPDADGEGVDCSERTSPAGWCCNGSEWAGLNAAGQTVECCHPGHNLSCVAMECTAVTVSTEENCHPGHNISCIPWDGAKASANTCPDGCVDQGGECCHAGHNLSCIPCEGGETSLDDATIEEHLVDDVNAIKPNLYSAEGRIDRDVIATLSNEEIVLVSTVGECYKDGDYKAGHRDGVCLEAGDGGQVACHEGLGENTTQATATCYRNNKSKCQADVQAGCKWKAFPLDAEELLDIREREELSLNARMEGKSDEIITSDTNPGSALQVSVLMFGLVACMTT